MSIFRLLAGLVIVWCIAFGPSLATAQVQDDAAQTLLQRLVEASNAERTAVLKRISESGDERARGWLEAFSAGKLATVKESGVTVIVLNNVGRNWTIASALNGEEMGKVSRRDLATVRVNNSLRKEVEGLLAVIDLTAQNPDVRLAAARDLLGEVDGALASLIEQRVQVEDSTAVRDMLTTALAIHQLEQGDVSAVETLSGSLNANARAALNNAKRKRESIKK